MKNIEERLNINENYRPEIKDKSQKLPIHSTA
jgi:hypothetical protein